MRLALLALALLACKDDAATDDSAVDSQPEVESVDAAAARYLIGEFDSQEQSQSQPSYYPISLVTCRLDMPELGEHVLYVEQALMEPPDDPYRQRVYGVTALDDGRALTAIYTLPDDRAAIGLCDDPSAPPFAAGELTEKEGCGVYLTPTDAGFEGSTEGTGCETNLGGDYASSQVTLTADRLESWDRGFYLDGQQAWGAEDGPYVFIRRSALSEP